MHAADPWLPPSGEQAETRLTGSVGAPCAHAGVTAPVVRSSGATTVAAAVVTAVRRPAERGAVVRGAALRRADKRYIRYVRSMGVES
ncbi:hypothetical protein [Streptomyces sp. NBC_00391]|uniref:hypothetical protein n=1 Tax=Streptomyces sp. NBC_00391 TaxID=2903647 RepID=UPI002E24F05F